MKPNHGQEAVTNRTAPKWAVLFADLLIPAPRQNISELFLRQQADVPDDHEIVRDHNSPDDPVIGRGADIDLKEGSVFYSRPKCGDQVSNPSCNEQPKIVVSLDDRNEVVITSDQTKASILELFGMDHSVDLFKDMESPRDFKIETDQPVSLCEGNVFITRSVCVPDLVEITINGDQFPIKPGKYTIDEIKALPNPDIQPIDELSILVDGELTLLPLGECVSIVGGEVFASNSPSGGAS